MAELTGKTVLITGAAKRIGAVIARRLHAAGARIVIHYRTSSEAAKLLATELNVERVQSAIIYQANLCDIKQLPKIIDYVLLEYGRLDVLINNASSFYPTLVGEITEQQWDDLLCSNLKAPLFLSQAAASALQDSNGCIINMIDIHGMRPMKGHSVYSAAKAGLYMLTQSLARELGEKVRVNGIAPGAILWPEDEVNQVSQIELLAKTALKKQGSPDDIAATVLFLVRDAPYITGQVIAVDGGRMLNH
ncbi:MAG TPA: pteridine reductase [Thiothrix sp.]|nr:pteridine reductase [Thiothrix sp.]